MEVPRALCVLPKKKFYVTVLRGLRLPQKELDSADAYSPQE